jgi:hypothetical protein
MGTDENRPNTGDEAREPEATGNEGMPGHASRRTQKSHTRRLKTWVREHKGEVVWALVFAIVFAWPAARFIEPPKHDPYKIHVVEFSHTDEDTKKMFETLAQDWSNQPRRIGDVPVQLQETALRDDSSVAAKETAERLAQAPDTLMVIGHLSSGLTKVSLPVYLGARPQVPYVSTTASDDELLGRRDGNGLEMSDFVPVLQPSPRNSDQGASAVRFAIQKQKHDFLIVTEDDPNNETYSSNMIQAYRLAAGENGANVVGTHKMGPPPSPGKLETWRPDCVLYAGSVGGALTLLRSLKDENIMVILSDSVIESRGTDKRLLDLSSLHNSVYVTYATNAADYSLHSNLYGKEAVGIAEQLIDDLAKRGVDLRYRLKSLAHLEHVEDARRNLVRIMAENQQYRAWYACESEGACIFDKHKRQNGMFHVWHLPAAIGSEMQDVDPWHRPKIVARQLVSAIPR